MTDRQESLIAAMLTLVAQGGRGQASARNVAALAGVALSSISYHFGSMEQLYCSAQAVAAERARAWLASRLNDLPPGNDLPPTALPRFMGHVVHRFVREQLPLAQTEADALVGASRTETAARAVDDWFEVWRGFWREAFARFGLDAEAAEIGGLILSAERLGHLARWNDLLDPAGLEEVCVRLVGRLTGDAEMLARPAPWRERAEALTLAGPARPPLTGPAERIARAVVAVIDEEGEAALTHRAVAATAGVSLGAVAHHFPSRTALLDAAYTELYRALVEGAEKVSSVVPKPKNVAEHMVLFHDYGAKAPRSRALDEMFLAATRDPALADFAARLRYSRGNGSFRMISAESPHVTRLDGVLISHWTAGASRASGGGRPSFERAAAMFEAR